MKPILHKILITLIYITQLLSLVLFGYIVIAHFLNLLTIDTSVDVRVFELDYLRLLMAIGLSTSIVATLLLIALRKVAYVSFFRQTLREKVTYLFVTITLSYFFAVSPHVAVKKELAIFIPVLIVLVAVIPSLLESFMQFEFRDYRHLISSFKAPVNKIRHHAALYIVLTVGALIVCSINAFLVAYITSAYVNGTVEREADLRKSLYIVRAAPAKTIQAKKVILYGYNMGWNRDGRSQVMSNAGKIPTGVWNNTEVEFEMPLSVKEGKWQFWVKRSENDSDAQSKLLVSNKVIIEVASRFTYYPTANDSPIERQIKKIKRFLFL